MISLSLARTSLSLSPLVITDDHSASRWVSAVGQPDFAYRYTYAPDSSYIAGKQLLAAVLEASALPATIYVRASTTASVEALKAELAAAVSQFSYTVTLAVDGVVGTWQADPTWPQWGVLDSGMVAAGMAATALTIPINPAGV